MGALLGDILYYSNISHIVPNSKHQINVIDFFKNILFQNMNY